MHPIPVLIRQLATLAALIGCALAIGPVRGAKGSTCHVADRPIFGLSSDPSPGSSTIPTDASVDVDLERLSPSDRPIRVDSRCPSEAPDRPPSSRVVDTGELPMLSAKPPPSSRTRGRLRPEESGSRPLPDPGRIDRPPRIA